MSTTFSLPREYTSVTDTDREAVRSAPCPECGGQPHYLGLIQPDRDCGSCYGYGGDTEAEDRLRERDAREDGEFNVNLANARYIVQDILNLPSDAVDYGSLEPSTVLVRLATAGVFAQNGVKEPSEGQEVRLTEQGVSLGCRWFEGGRSLEQIESYITRLRRLAEIAVERGAPSIVWG